MLIWWSWASCPHTWNIVKVVLVFFSTSPSDSPLLFPIYPPYCYRWWRRERKKNKRAAWLTSLSEVAGPVSSNLTTAPIRQYTSYRSERNRWRNCVFRYSLLFLCFSFFFKNELFLYFHRAPWPLFTSGRKNSYISRLFNFVFGPHWFLLYTGGKARHLSSSHKVKITLTSFPFSPIFSFVRLTLYK